MAPVPDPDLGASTQELPHWNAQQKILWPDVRRETRRGKVRFKVRDLFADGRCSQAILDFLSTMNLGRPAWAEGKSVSYNGPPADRPRSGSGSGQEPVFFSFIHTRTKPI